MIDDVFSLILLSMLTVVQEADQGGGVDTWIFLRPLLASFVVTVVGFVSFRLVDAHWAAFAARVARGSPRVRGVLHSRAQETMLLVLLGVGALAAWLSEGLFSTLLLVRLASTDRSSLLRDWTEIGPRLGCDRGEIASPAAAGRRRRQHRALQSAESPPSLAALPRRRQGIFCVGAAFCTVPLAREAYVHVTPVQAWASRCFFGATVGFQIPVNDLFSGGNVGQGVVLTIAAILGKWLSGVSLTGEPRSGAALAPLRARSAHAPRMPHAWRPSTRVPRRSCWAGLGRQRL